MYRLLPLAIALSCAACAPMPESPDGRSSAPSTRRSEARSQEEAAAAPPPAPEPAPVPLPLEQERTNGIGKRVVIDGLAVWVQALEYKPLKVRLKTGEIKTNLYGKILTLTVGLQGADPAKKFAYTTWSRMNTKAIRDAKGRGWGHLHSDGFTPAGRIESAEVTFDKPVTDELLFTGGHSTRNPPGSAEPFTPDFTAYFDINLPYPPSPFDNKRMYRFRVHAPEVQ